MSDIRWYDGQLARRREDDYLADVQRVYASPFGAGPRHKAIEFPVAYYACNQFDEVPDPAGAFAGVSCRAGYINPGEQTTIRATVAPAPFTPAVRERFREPVGAS